MQKIKAGIMICQIREHKKISRKKLSAGLCTKGAMSKYESGEGNLDGLLFHCFMQRMGVSPEDFSVMLSLKEYRYYLWKETVFEAIQKQEWEAVQTLFDDSLAKDRSCNRKIQRQFYCYLSSVLAEKIEKNQEKTLLLLQEAICETVPDGLKDGLELCLLSAFEIGLMVLYYYKSGVWHKVSSEEVYTKLKLLIAYTMKNITDKRECARLMPGMVCALLNICGERMSLAERIYFEEEAVSLLKESYKFYHLPELLRFYVRDLLSVDGEKAHVYEKQYDAFLEVFQDAGYDTEFQPELLFDSRKQIYLLNEYMRSFRDISGLTQEQISEGICVTETYSRLETGKRAPHFKEGERLMERLNVGWGFFRGDLETTDYRVFEYLHQFKEAAKREEWDKARGQMERIKAGLDMQSTNNRQYVGMMENRIAYATGQMGMDEFYRRDKELLELSVRKENLEKTELYYFSHIEIVLHTHLANILRMMGRQREGIALLEGMLKKQGKSQVDVEYWWGSIGASIFNLANMLSDIGNYEISLDYMEEFIKKCLKLYDGKFISYGLCEKAFDLEHLKKANKATCERLLVQVIYLTDFYDIRQNNDRLKMYFAKRYDINKQWY